MTARGLRGRSGVGARAGGSGRARQGKRPGFYTEIGRKGGEAVRDAHGTEFYSQIGKKGREARAKRQREAAGS